jgi:DNA-binding transcriptional MerR regulator
MTAIEAFPTSLAAKIARVSVDTLENWRRRQILLPSVATTARGRGASCGYTFRDLVAIRVLVALRDAGIDPRGLRRVVDYLRHRKGLSATDALASTLLITDGHDVYELDGSTFPTSALRRPGQTVFHGVVLDILVAELQRDTRAAVKTKAA